MTAFNAVRFKVKPGRNQEFLDAHEKIGRSSWPGLNRINLIQTGDQTYCKAESRSLARLVKDEALRPPGLQPPPGDGYFAAIKSCSSTVARRARDTFFGFVSTNTGFTLARSNIGFR